MVNAIQWSQKIALTDAEVHAMGLTTMSAWQDHSFYHVPFTGRYNCGNISAAIAAHGGQGKPASVTLVEYDPARQRGVVRVEYTYYIGD